MNEISSLQPVVDARWATLQRALQEGDAAMKALKRLDKRFLLDNNLNLHPTFFSGAIRASLTRLMLTNVLVEADPTLERKFDVHSHLHREWCFRRVVIRMAMKKNISNHVFSQLMKMNGENWSAWLKDASIDSRVRRMWPLILAVDANARQV